MSSRITAAVVGVGAIGAAVADQLDPQRVELQLCRRRPSGMTVVSPTGVSSVGGRVVVDPGDAEPVDWVILAVKATQDPSPWLDRLVGSGTRVAILQNGIDLAARVQRWVTADRTVPVVVQNSAERISDDVVAVRYEGGLLTDQSQAARQFRSLFREETAVSGVPDFEVESWRKLMLNVVVNSITTMTGGPSTICTSAELLPLTRALLLETVQVAVVAGVPLTAEDEELVLGRVRDLPAVCSSMQSDAHEGRPLEYEFITGAVLQHADRAGLLVPSVRAVHALLAGRSWQSTRGARSAQVRAGLANLGDR